MEANFNECKRYMHGEMTDQEKREFEQRLQDDPEFLESAQENVQTLQAIGREQIREEAEKGFQELEEAEKRRKAKVYKTVGLAATLLLLCVVGLGYSISGPSEMKALFQQHHEYLKVGTRGGDTNSLPLWESAMTHYEAGNKTGFKASSKQFEQLLGSPNFPDSLRDEAHLYLGASYLEQGNAQLAIYAFEKVNQGNIRFAGDAAWYRALAMLKLEKSKMAIDAFEDFARNDRWPLKRRKVAVEILGELRTLKD